MNEKDSIRSSSDNDELVEARRQMHFRWTNAITTGLPNAQRSNHQFVDTSSSNSSKQDNVVILLSSDEEGDSGDNNFDNAIIRDNDAAFAASLQKQLDKEDMARQERQYASDAAFATSLQQKLFDVPIASATPLSVDNDKGDRKTAEMTASHALFRSQQVPESSSVCTTGLLESIISVYNKNRTSNGNNADKNTNVYLSTATSDHYNQVLNPNSRGRKQFGEPERSDGYSCGYRSMQMICSALFKANPELRSQMFGRCGFVPSLENMKHWLENAWEEGWDPVGYAQLGSVVGKRTWVGTTECWALLSSFGIAAKIVSFSKENCNSTAISSSSSQLEQPIKKRKIASGSDDLSFVARRVEQWLLEYFEVDKKDDIKQDDDSLTIITTKTVNVKNPWNCYKTKQDVLSSSNSLPSLGSSRNQEDQQQPIRMIDKLPLYMQHDGHSRVVIGVAVRYRCRRGNDSNGSVDAALSTSKNSNTARKYERETQLLLFDPISYGPDLKASLDGNTKNWHGMIKRGIHTLKKPQYQFIVVTPNEPIDLHCCSKYPNPDNKYC